MNTQYATTNPDPLFAEALKVGGRVMEMPRKRPLRIYWNSNCPWGTSGYSNQTREAVSRIRKMGGIDIACGNFFGLEGGILPGIAIEGFEDVPQYPKMADVWGVDGMIHHAKDFNADCVMSLQDPWPMDLNGLSQVSHYIPWVPVDHEPIPEITKQRLNLAYRIIAMSKFGQAEMERQGFHSTYIPHSVDTNQMIILDKKECRQMLNIPEDIFLIGVVGANKEIPSRKGFEYILRSFAKFHKKNPKSGIYFHVNMTQPGGLNIIEWTDPKHYDFADSIYYLPPYEQQFKVGRDQMTKIMNCFDVLMAPSISEGFGIPIIEAQAVGVPVITPVLLLTVSPGGRALPVLEYTYVAVPPDVDGVAPV